MRIANRKNNMASPAANVSAFQYRILNIQYWKTLSRLACGYISVSIKEHLRGKPWSVPGFHDRQRRHSSIHYETPLASEALTTPD
jgi:hypothetical protein